MHRTEPRIAAALLGIALALQGCSNLGDTLFPSLSGDDPRAAKAKSSAAAARSDAALPPTYSPGPVASASLPPLSVTPGQPTGTYVGAKVQQFRTDLQNLQGSVSQQNQRLQQLRSATIQESQGYFSAVGAINARLQVGTTPGNPILVQQWTEAQAQLNRLDGDIANMNQLATRVSADAAMSGYMLDSVRAAYALSGAVDEDHRQLAILEDEVNRTVVLIDRLLNEVNEDLNRQTTYLSSERRNMTTLSLAIKNGELYGGSLRNRVFAGPSSLAPPMPAAFSPGVDSSRPLVVIRFDRPDVPYEQALYSAISQAMERRPSAAFQVVAVSPSGAQVAASRRNADKVMRTLTDIGLPPDRVSTAATTSASARTSEVQIYVR